MSKKAVILAGGKGTRLKPYTAVLPKPLMPVGEYPILEVLIRQLKHFGVTDITLAVNHQAELIRAFFNDGSRLGVDISYSLETKPLSTMGPLSMIDDLPEDFLVMNGDILSDINFKDLLTYHREKEAIFTIAASKREASIDYGVLKVVNEVLVGFEEKPSLHYEVSMGIYAVNKKILNYIPKDTAFGFNHLMDKLLSLDIPVNVFSFDGKWLDIGRADDYMQAIDEFEQNEALYLYE
ncbi:MAG: sugar phosphate nucleotidyltransferase [Oscillospiraceae bacterium]|nr:sugar phosphate nucleotidyltransferase [Oscillospiraceae bacterium]